MARIPLTDRLSPGGLILDGGMGSQLIARQIHVDRCNELLNLDRPEVIEAIHRDYVEAGSGAVLTNTFGASPIALKRYEVDGRTEEICGAAVAHARCATGPEGLVLGDIGPCGEFLAPLGPLQPGALRDALVRQAGALHAAGVDGFIVETLTALEEAEVAVAAVHEVAQAAPVLVSMAFDAGVAGFRTMMGVTPGDWVARAADWGVTAVGFNCGSASLAEYETLAAEILQAAAERGLPVCAEPNAGKPELEGTRPVYRVGPEAFADTAERLAEGGVAVLGGCCGTGPEHIQAVARRLRG